MINSIMGKRFREGATGIRLGGCGDDRVNCIPTTPGWSYAIRLYQPREEILNGSWSFPEIDTVN